MGAAWGPGWCRPAALRHLVVREKHSAAVTGDLTTKPLEAKTRVTVLRLAARGLQGCTDIRATRKGKPRADTPTGSLLGFCLDGRHLGFCHSYSRELSAAATSKGRRGPGNKSPRVGLYFCSWGSRGGWGLWVVSAMPSASPLVPHCCSGPALLGRPPRSVLPCVSHLPCWLCLSEDADSLCL